MKQVAVLIAGLWAGALCLGGAHAADKMDFLICQAYQDNSEKLACYDELAKRIIDGETIECKKEKTNNENHEFVSYRIPIPSDGNANYTVIGKSGTKENPILTTVRSSAEGIGYSKREFNCRSNTFRYLGSGPTRAKMDSSQPDVMTSPVIEGSIAWYLLIHACGR